MSFEEFFRITDYESYREYVADLKDLIEDYKNSIMPLLLYHFRKYGTTDPDVSDNKDFKVLCEFCNRIQEYIAETFGVEDVEIIDCRCAYDDWEICEDDIDIRYTIMTEEEFNHDRAIEIMSNEYDLSDNVSISNMVEHLLDYIKARRYFEEKRPDIKDPILHSAILSKYDRIVALLTVTTDNYNDVVDIINRDLLDKWPVPYKSVP